MGVFLDQKLCFCYTCSMKKYILVLLLALVGCSSLKTTDQRSFTWNGDAAVLYLKTNAQARAKADAELDRMLADFPAKTFDLLVGIPETRPTMQGQVELTIPVKMNFKRDWLINFWQHLYALNQKDGGAAQITVKSLYDMYDTNDVYYKADVVQGTVSFADTGRFLQIQRAMVISRPNIQVTLLDSKNRPIFTQIVNTPSLSHAGLYPGVPVFVDIGDRSNMYWFKFPIAKYQMTIDGHTPIFTAAQIVVSQRIADQTRDILVDIVRQN